MVFSPSYQDFPQNRAQGRFGWVIPLGQVTFYLIDLSAKKIAPT
jgi:hypothetical protein